MQSKKSLLHKLYTQLRRVSLYKRLLFLFLLLIFLVFSSLSILVFQSLKDYEENITFESAQLINDFEHQINSALSTLDSVTKYQIIQNAYSSSDIYSYLSGETEILTKDYSKNAKFLNELKPVFDIDPTIYSISIIDQWTNHLFCYNDGWAYHLFSDNPDADFLRLAEDKKGGLVVIPQTQLDSPLLTLPDNSLCGIRSIISLFPRHSIGTVFCCVDLSDALDSFDLRKTFPNEEIAFFDQNNQLLLGQGELSSDTASMVRSHGIQSKNKLQRFVITENHTRYLYAYTYSENESLCILRVPYKNISNAIIHDKISLFSLLILSFVGIIILVKLLVSSIQDPIEALSSACKTIRDGNFGYTLDDDANDEMHDLTVSFNEMSEKIAFLIEEVYQKEMLQSETELQLLRSQINPHFMYNTLETIRSRAIINHDSEIIEMVTLFGQLLRYGVSNATSLVTTQEVHSYLKNYVRLQQLHYKQSILININFDPELDDKYMLKLLLQPLLENAITHSNYESNRTCMIDVIGYLEYDCMVFRVSDNGQGVSEQKVKEINDTINEKNTTLSGIGLRNVNRRIKLFYGEDYGVFFESMEHYGSVVTVTIPVDHNTEIPQ